MCEPAAKEHRKHSKEYFTANAMARKDVRRMKHLKKHRIGIEKEQCNLWQHLLVAYGRSCLRGPEICVHGMCQKDVSPSLHRHHIVYIAIISDFIADSITKSKRCIYGCDRTAFFALMPTDQSYIEIEIGVISSQNWYCSIPSKNGNCVKASSINECAVMSL